MSDQLLAYFGRMAQAPPYSCGLILKIMKSITIASQRRAAIMIDFTILVARK